MVAFQGGVFPAILTAWVYGQGREDCPEVHPRGRLGCDDEQAKYSGQTLTDGAHLKELHEGTAAACTDASADERNDRVAHVCSKDCGLGDTD